MFPVLPGVREQCGGFRQMIRIYVAQRHNLQLGVRLEIVQVIPPHAADADAGVLQLRVGRKPRPPDGVRRNASSGGFDKCPPRNVGDWLVHVVILSAQS